MQNDSPRDTALTGGWTLNGVGAWRGPEPPELNARMIASALREGALLDYRISEKIIEESIASMTEEGEA
jgi:hypothetical protein